MIINKSDVLWNYGATFLKIASSIIILPLVLKVLPPETVGIWTVFMTITAFANLLDFGFNPSFERNVTYVFSGVKELNKKGYQTVKSSQNVEVDYGLLKALIEAMRWIYLRISLLLFFILMTLGTFYIYNILKNYHGDKQEIYIAWFLLCFVSTYNLFTLYYDTLLQGRGMVKRAKQIVIVGYLIYLLISTLLIIFNFGLIAIVAAQVSSTIVIRFLSYRSFFTYEIKESLKASKARNKKEILKIIYPNSIKIGLTSLGGFTIQKSAMIIGALYLSLEDIASYGITMQLIAVLSSLSGIYLSTFIPKIVHLRVLNNVKEIKKIYLKGEVILVASYIIGGFFLLILGPFVLEIVGSKTLLLSTPLLLLALFLSLVETNLSNAGNILLTKNDVPFFKASLVSGLFVILGLFLSLKYFQFGIYAMFLTPLIVDFAYQAWKWPYEVVKDLEFRFTDLIKSNNGASK